MSFFNPAANFTDDVDRYQTREPEAYIYMYDAEAETTDELEAISI